MLTGAFQASGSFWGLFPRPRALVGGRGSDCRGSCHSSNGRPAPAPRGDISSVPPRGKLAPQDLNNNLASKCAASLRFLHFKRNLLKTFSTSQPG